MCYRKHLSLKAKLAICFIAISSLAMVVFLAVNYSLTCRNYREAYLEDNRNNLRISSENLVFHLDSVLELSLYPYKDDGMMSVLASKNLSYDDKVGLKTKLMSLLNSNEALLQLHFYWAQEGLGFIGRNRAVFQKQEEAPSDIVFSPSKVYTLIHQEGDYGLSFGSYGGKEVLTIRRDIFDLPRQDYLGTLELDVDISILSSSLIGLYSGNGDSILFLGGGLDKPYVYPSQRDDLDSFLDGISFASREGMVRRNGSTILYQSLQPKLGMEDGYLVKIIPDKEITRLASSTALISLATGIVILIASLVAIIFVAKKFTEPFSYIEKQLEKISQGDLSVHLDIQDTEEFSLFAEQFNDMIESLNNVVLRSYQLDISNKNNQLKALQAQLNPHFINNTLQTIGAEALKDNNLKLYMAVMEFGEMMRYTMNFQALSVSFRDELNYTENYMKLQKMRFDERFSYRIEASEETLSVLVPKLALQPLVENVFKYGFAEGVEKVFVQIVAKIQDGCFHLECFNSGCPVSLGKLELLRAELEDARSLEGEGERIGLRNLARRLQLLYGSKGIMTLSSGDGLGFKVEVSFPLGGKE